MAKLPHKSTTRSLKRKERSRFSDEYGLLLQHLIEARLASGVTQGEIAKRLGKTQSHVSMCENREREISIIDLWKWCDAIGLSVGALLLQFEAEVKDRKQLTPRISEGRSSDQNVQ